jgi:hypothetical protein
MSSSASFCSSRSSTAGAGRQTRRQAAMGESGHGWKAD